MDNAVAVAKEMVSFLNKKGFVVYNESNPNEVMIDDTVRKIGMKLSEDKKEVLGNTVYGMVRKNPNDNKDIEIVVRDSLDKDVRKRTVAHELGHAVLHVLGSEETEYKDSVFYKKYLSRYTTEEREANAFEDELIMPEDKFTQFIRENARDGRINLDSVAAAFGVSVNTANARARSLDILM